MVTKANANGDEEEVFEANSEGNLQGLYFDAPEAGETPDLLRLIDQEVRKASVGLLESISTADLRNTDVLFFREATGQLIMERNGLKEAEVRGGEVQLDEETQLVGYRVMLRGPRDWSLNIGGVSNRHQGYENWATEYQLTEPFQQKDSDYIREGETIKIVAINRATGYMGTAKAKIDRTSLGGLTVLAQPIILRPPNLKIWAERKYNVDKGLTKGESRNYTIGAEGAALTSDSTITIYTEWLDEYGNPLPDELGLDNGEQYGFTGRLAKVVAPNQLQGVGAGNDLASFAIAPGRKTQVISVGSNLTTAEHYYVHVIGKGKDQECGGGGSCPSFSTTGTTAPYDSRPNLLVPFLVPLPDEDRTWIDYRIYRGLLSDEAITNKPNKPLPAYSWAYRPEYQFSQYGLEMQEINATSTNANGAETSTNILQSNSPTITSSDDYITALYSLISSNNDRLTAIDGPQELVLALGEEEQLITIGEDQSITFSNIAHLASLDPEDFLSMRLYTNNDASNILWEYAFGSFGVYPEVELEISADDHFTYITAMSVHGDGSDIGWKLIENSGGGNISENATELDEQVSIITLNTSTKAGDTYKVRSQLINIETQSGVKAIGSYLDTGLIKVIAGKPDTIQITKNIEHYPSDNTGTVTLTALIKDQFGNHVEDGTAVTWLANESTSSFISVENITVDGLVTAELRSPKLPVDQVVTVMSGDVVHSTTMKVNRVSGSLTSDVAVINVDNTETATITANVNATDGTPVFWMSSNGVVLGDNFVTDGKATAILSGGLVGEVAVTATIGDRLLLWEGSFESNSAIKVKVEHPYIVAGEKSNGIGEVVRGDGTVSKIPYWSSSNVEVTGPENAWLDIGVSDNKKTEIFLFEELDVDITKGNLKGHEIKVSGAILDTIVRHSGSGAFLFDGQGQGVITHHDDFNFKEEFSISVWLRPNEITNAQILKKGSDWQLTLLDDGKIKATIKTNVASYEVISDAKVEVGSWSYVSIDYGSNGLRLTIGVDAKSNGNAQGLLSNNNGNIAIADNFNGHVDDLVFSSTNKDAEIRFEGLDGTGRLQLDSSGHANFQVLNTGDLTSRISSRVPITIRSTPVRQSKTKLSRSISVLSNSPSEATEDEESVTTYVQIVERDTWFLLVDTVTSFFGGDPESGAGFVSNIAGGMAIVGDVGAITKNSWRATGWSDNEPNLVETFFSGLGLLTEAAVGFGEVADLPISVVKSVSSTFGDTPFTRTLATRVKDSVIEDVPFSEAESAIVKQLSEGDYALGKVFNEVVTSDELYKAAIRSGDKLGDDFLDVFTKIATDPRLGKSPAEALILVLSKSSDDVLKNIKESTVPLVESLTAIAKSSAKVSPELMTKILGNDNLYSAAYKQGDLLKDIDSISHVDGFELLARSLSYGNVNGLKVNPGAVGFRWELDSAAQLTREGIEVERFTKILLDPATKKVSTDIDMILKNGTYVQAKASKSTIGGVKGTAPLGSERQIRNWVKKAQMDGATKIIYIVPKGTHISPGKVEIFEDLGVIVVEKYLLK